MNLRVVFGTMLPIVALLLAGCDRPVARQDSEPIEEEHSALVGQPAPEIEAKLVDGTPFSLKQAVASNVVLLDFWATWCPPCVMELPVLIKIADEFKAEGVALYAVNAGEDADTIQAFMGKKGWDFPVVLDPDGKHATAYQVSGIPQLVVIGRDGKIHQLHVGFSENLESQLRSELKSVLASSSK